MECVKLLGLLPRVGVQTRDVLRGLADAPVPCQHLVFEGADALRGLAEAPVPPQHFVFEGIDPHIPSGERLPELGQLAVLGRQLAVLGLDVSRQGLHALSEFSQLALEPRFPLAGANAQYERAAKHRLGLIEGGLGRVESRHIALTHVVPCPAGEDGVGGLHPLGHTRPVAHISVRSHLVFQLLGQVFVDLQGGQRGAFGPSDGQLPSQSPGRCFPVHQHVVIANERPLIAAAVGFGLQHVAQPQEGAKRLFNEVAPRQRRGDLQRIAHRQHQACRGAKRLQALLPEGEQAANPRVFEHEQGAVAEFTLKRANGTCMERRGRRRTAPSGVERPPVVPR